MFRVLRGKTFIYVQRSPDRTIQKGQILKDILVRAKSPKHAGITRGWGSRRLVTRLLSARTISWIVFVSLVPDMLMLESARSEWIRPKTHRFRSRMLERPAVVPCTTSGSGVLVRDVFPVPFELKFCQFDFDYCLFERQLLILETTCFMMDSFEVDIKRQFEV